MKITHLITRIRVLAVLALLASTGAHADLMYARLGGAAVYDATTNLTWVSNANLAATNTFGVSGIDPAGSMSWAIANSWIAGMDAANYLGYNNWALPTTLQPDATCGSQKSGGVSYGYGCTGSQMGNLFYNALGGVAHTSITTTHNANYNLFSNFQSGNYWSGTEYAPNNRLAWNFHFSNGGQYVSTKSNSMHALAVRSGDVGDPSAVPEPASVALLGIGLLGLMGARRRKQAA